LFFKNYKPEILFSVGAYPFNLLGIIQRSPNLKISDTFTVLRSLYEMVNFDYDKVYDRFDDMTFYEWSKKYNIHKKFFDVMYKPALSVVFNEPEKISAAEVLVFIHMYFLSDAKADTRMITKMNSYDAVLKPWLEHLEKLNVKIHTGHSVNSLKINENDLSVYGSNDDKNIYDHVIIASDIKHTKQIFENTIQSYKDNEKIKNAIEASYNSTISNLKIAPSYKARLK
jgi:carotenoid phi-ring synthase / carotenoid chi-ring synthase